MVCATRSVYDVYCKHCGTMYQILANRDDVHAWLSGSGYIQDVLGYLSPAERELMISNTCNNCWNQMFPEVGEDEE